MDALSEILRSARLTGGVFLRGEFTEPWCLASAVTAADFSDLLGPADHLMLYHFVSEGELVVEIYGEPPRVFLPGQAAILVRNDGHTLSGREAAPAVSALDVARMPAPGQLMIIEHGGGGTPTRIICGFLGGSKLAADPLFSELPKLIGYDCATARSGDLIRSSLEFAADEVASDRPGSGAMLARISELLFVEAVREYVEGLPPDLGGWFEALRDPVVSRALSAIHRYPERNWTVEAIGREVGASRSALGERFTRHLGLPPVEYLTQLRMKLAARELSEGTASIFDVAERVGYGSEAAFSRAFKRTYNISPSEWRKRSSGRRL